MGALDVEPWSNVARITDPKWRWIKIVNTNFSGIFTIEDFQNSKNDVAYAEDASEIPADLREAPKVKYPSDVMFWGTIYTKSLVPNDSQINFT
ncbi:unnamed protein product [Rotaria sp. Silwood1]|nr:unnamed protein product [Rotaria sp. Silwood1]